MKYYNPVISGFFPDPSICTDGEKYYLVCSSFQYFPGVPLFTSDNLVTWQQIGHVLTRKSQLPLEHAGASGGIFAPTIRYHAGRFYMITTNVSDGGNFFVYTDDIHGEWSDPVYVDAGGIDPSLCFAEDHVYFTGTGADADGRQGIVQCELDMETGKCVSSPRCIWLGAGGRYLEGPHLYKIKDWWYLLAAEGGTEYGHMEVCARSRHPYGPFESCPHNPFLTNRNLGGYGLQVAGHMDLEEDHAGNYWGVLLAFRQMDRWLQFHTIGRETCLVPLTFDSDGWIAAGDNGTARLVVETDRLPQIQQPKQIIRNFSNTKAGREWVFVRNPDSACYDLLERSFILRGNGGTLSDDSGSPTFVAIRQEQMLEKASCWLLHVENEAGLTVYMDNRHHYDLAVRKTGNQYEIFRRLCIGDVSQEQNIIFIDGEEPDFLLKINCTPERYHFYVECSGHEYDLGSAAGRYLSTEVAGGFTGVMLGLYAVTGSAEFTEFEAIADCLHEAAYEEEQDNV